MFVVEPLGKNVIVDLRVGENIFKVETGVDFKANTGDDVWMLFNKDKIYFFDKKTSQVIV